MRTIALVLLILVFGSRSFGQNMSLNAMIRINTMDAGWVNDYFNSTHQFDLYSADNSKGYAIAQYHNRDVKDKQELITTGDKTVTITHEVLHQISYWSNYYWYVEGLRKQIETAGYRLALQGSDAQRNIWMYDNPEYEVDVYINKDRSQGTVEIKQKHALPAGAY